MSAAPDTVVADEKVEAGRLARALGFCRRKFERSINIFNRVMAHTWADGFIHAGNLAYLSLLTLFPFFIIVAAIASTFGQSDDALIAINNFLATLPRDVVDLIAK